MLSLISRIEGLLTSHPAPIKALKVRDIGPKPVLAFPCGFFTGPHQTILVAQGLSSI